MANILLIYPKPEEIKNWRFGFSLQLLYIAAILRNAGHTIIDYLDFSVCSYSWEELTDKLLKTDNVFIELDSFTLKRSTNENHALELSRSIKSGFPDVKLFACGHGSILGGEEIPGFDYTFLSEPENSVVKVVESFQNGNFERDDSLYIENIDALPFPARDLLSGFTEHGGSIQSKPSLAKSTVIQTSRGCMNSCSFCQRKGWTKRFRPHSVEYVINEFKYLREKGYANIWVADDNFSFDINRAKNILNGLIENKISENMNIALSSWVRIDREFLDLAKAANVKTISYGIESANMDILEFYNKSIDLDRTRELITYADSIGLYSVGNFIIGAPMETEKSIQQTAEYIKNTPFDQINVKILDYMPGSDLYASLSDEIRNTQKHLFASKESGLSIFSLEELRSFCGKINLDFKRGRSSMLKSKMEKWGPPYSLRKTGL